MKFTPNLTRSEQKRGMIAVIFCLLILPGLLTLVMPGLGAARLNFATYFITAGAAVWVLRRFLLHNLRVALTHPIWCLYYAALGYLGHTALSEIAALLVYLAAPGFVNLNNQAIVSQLNDEFSLMVFTTVVLAPIVEECLFRGLLFRGFYDRSPALAWTLSAGLFAAAHLTGSIGSSDPAHLLLSFLLYLPAGIVLCFSYQRGGNIFCPILTHAIINCMAVWSATR